MSDKNAMPVLVDTIIMNEKKFEDKSSIKLSSIETFIENIDNLKDIKDWDYKYYPYVITPQEISMVLVLSKIAEKNSLLDPKSMADITRKLYYQLNFSLENNYKLDDEEDADEEDDVEVVLIKDKYNINQSFVTRVGNGKKDCFEIAIANTKLSQKDFIGVLTEKPNRSYDRYKKVCQIVNEAIKANADILVLPESYLPIEWLPILSRTCAKNQIAVVTGIEHVKSIDTIYNLTATILPYMKDEFRFAHISFHTKVHYAPEEMRCITSYGYNSMKGNDYNLLNWHDLWFSTYCCFELASISDRSRFQQYVDLVVAVEWNADTNYYSNIIESLSRDLHCYCVQVNSSNYGDSRITMPSKTETKDIVKTKGGYNSTILIDRVDIKSLREFQIKGYELQKDDKRFKPTPPEFDVEITKRKIRGNLWGYIKELQH